MADHPHPVLGTVHEDRVKILTHAKPATTKPEAGSVLLWMQSGVRPTRDNLALVHAVRRASELSRPLVVAFALTGRYPGANARSYTFLLQGVAACFRALATSLGIGTVLLTPATQEEGPGVPERVAELAAALEAPEVVTDVGYLHIQEEWRSGLAESLDMLGIPLVSVESNVVVPVRIATNKREHAARTIRPKINALRKAYLTRVFEEDAEDGGMGLIPEPPVGVQCYPFEHAWVEAVQAKVEGSLITTSVPGEGEDEDAWIAAEIERIGADTSVPAVAGVRGGWDVAMDKADHFFRVKMEDYGEARNIPGAGGTSKMSPYLHFGHVSPISLARRALDAKRAAPGNKKLAESVDSFVEELVVRRELAINFCVFTPGEGYKDYATIVPQWAQDSLELHKSDKREILYTDEEMERGETHDPFWNAAQLDLVRNGTMPGYLRMYWAKCVVQWVEEPSHAFDWLIAMNDKYELDGRDPNGYTGVAWCFGVHDRGWTERPVTGKIRYMNAKGLLRKYRNHIKEYAHKFSQDGEAQTSKRIAAMQKGAPVKRVKRLDGSIGFA